jgi:regulator of protease activity HflC (stomatin/prohibitin superfamily)
MKTFKLISWLMLGIGLIVLGGWILSLWLVGGLLLVLTGIWLLTSIRIIGPAEMAVFVLFGEPVGFRDSGPIFIYFPFGELKRYPKKMYDLEYPAKEVITKAGEYEGVRYGAQVLKVDTTVYLNFPREKGKEEEIHPLIKILRAGVPVEDNKLRDWTEEAVLSSLRTVFGKHTWREAIQNIEKINKEVEEIFKQEDGILWKAGFRESGIKLAISEIKLPPELVESLVEVDKQRLRSDAAEFTKERKAKEWVETVIEAMAKARGVDPKVIKNEINTNPELQREFLEFSKTINLRLEEAERGALVHLAIEGGGEGNFLDKVLAAIVAATKILTPTKAILDALAAWKRMPGGTIEKGKPTGTGIKREITKEDIERLKKKIEEKLKEKGLS